MRRIRGGRSVAILQKIDSWGSKEGSMDSTNAEGSFDERAIELVTQARRGFLTQEGCVAAAIASAVAAALWAPSMRFGGGGAWWASVVALWDANGDGTLSVSEFAGCLLPWCGAAFVGQTLAPPLLALLGVASTPTQPTASSAAASLVAVPPAVETVARVAPVSAEALTPAAAAATPPREKNSFLLRFPLETVSEANPRHSAAVTAYGLHPFFAASVDGGSGDCSRLCRWDSAGSSRDSGSSGNSGDLAGAPDAMDQSREGMLAYMATEFGGRGGHERLGLGASNTHGGFGPNGRPPGLAALAGRSGSLGGSAEPRRGSGSAAGTPPQQTSPGGSFDRSSEGGGGGGEASHDGSSGSWDTASSAESDHLPTAARALRRRRSSNESTAALETLLAPPTLGAAGHAANERRRLACSGRSGISQAAADAAAASVAAEKDAEAAAALTREADDLKFGELAARFHEWDLDVFQVFDLTPAPLVKVGFVTLDAFSHAVPIDGPKLVSFLQDVEAAYREVPYHNLKHGAAVGRAVFSFCKQPGGLANVLGEEAQFALVLAGLVHDINHPGVTSSFLLRASLDHLSDHALIKPSLPSKRRTQSSSGPFTFSPLKTGNHRGGAGGSEVADEAALAQRMVRRERRLQKKKAVQKQALKRAASEETVPCPSGLDGSPPPSATPEAVAARWQRRFQLSRKVSSLREGGPSIGSKSVSRESLGKIEGSFDSKRHDSDEEPGSFDMAAGSFDNKAGDSSDNDASASDEDDDANNVPRFSPFDRDLAVRYNDQSPLEQMHLAVTFSLLRRESNSFLTQQTLAAIRSVLVRAILGTDMAKHGETMARLDALISNLKGPDINHAAESTPGADASNAAAAKNPTAAAMQMPWYWPLTLPPGLRETAQQQAWALKQQEDFVVELFLHAADIGSPAMPFGQFQKWNRLVTEEFLEQGDLEVVEFGKLISPPAGFGRYNQSNHSRHGFTTFFIQFLSLPLFEKLDELTRIGVCASDEYLLPVSPSDRHVGTAELFAPHANDTPAPRPPSAAAGVLGEGNLVAGVSVGPCLANLRANLAEWARLTPPKPPPEHLPESTALTATAGDAAASAAAVAFAASASAAAAAAARDVEARRVLGADAPPPEEAFCWPVTTETLFGGLDRAYSSES